MDNRMGNRAFYFFHNLSCKMETADCDKCIIKKPCWWFLEMARMLDIFTDFFSMSRWIR